MEFVSIRVSTLRGDSKIPFNSYVLINGKHILLNRSGDSFEGERLSKLKQKKLKKLYIQTDEEKKYREYLEGNIESAFAKDSKKSIDDRAAIAQGVTQANTEAVMENPEDEVGYNTAKTGAARYSEFLFENNEALKHVLAQTNEDKNIVHHGVSVSGIAANMARRLGITDWGNMETLSLGSMLHDIGHTVNGFDRSQKLAGLSPEQIKIYKSHPTTGVEKVRSLKHFDQGVLRIIVEHEEQSDGKGFPAGLTEKKIDRLALICGVANAYDRFVTFDGHPPAEAIKKMFTDNVGLYPLGHLNALKAVLTESKII